MAFLEIRGQRHPIGMGETVIGCDEASVVTLGGSKLHSSSAILQGLPDGQVAVRRAGSDAEVLINGVRLGPQPTPLLHGDKIEIAGQELLFVDDRRSGSTEYIKAVDPATLGGSSRSRSKGGATAGTGGRLVSLTDGREYEIEGGSVLIGRDASCDIVLSAKNVSRRHAEVVGTPRGYILIDNSTNGTLVNNERVKGQHVLSRADVIRCGDHEFRFYADAATQEAEPEDSSPAAEAATDETAPPSPAPPPPDSGERQGDVVGPPDAPAPPIGAQQRLAHTMHGIPAMPKPGGPPVQPTSTPQAPTASKAEPQSATPTDQRLGAPPAGPPRGAEQRLAHTMHGIPAMPRPGQAGEQVPGTPPPGAEQRLQNTLHGLPRELISTPPPTGEGSVKGGPTRGFGAPKALGSLLVRSGALKGRRLYVKVPIVNIGRAEYNDIVLPDESVSTVHAKLQRREGIWVVVDLESTNGTIVDGERVDGEAPLAPGAIVRFGTIQTIFEPTDDSVQSQHGGGTQVLQPVKIPPPGGTGHSGDSGSGPSSAGGTPLG